MTPPEADEKHAEIASVDPGGREAPGLVGARCPVLHGVDGDTSFAQSADHVLPVLGEVGERRRHEGTRSRVAGTPAWRTTLHLHLSTLSDGAGKSTEVQRGRNDGGG